MGNLIVIHLKGGKHTSSLLSKSWKIEARTLVSTALVKRRTKKATVSVRFCDCITRVGGKLKSYCYIILSFFFLGFIFGPILQTIV